MRYPKTIRRADKSEYADVDRCFHLTIRAHPEVHRFAPAVAEVVWRSVVQQRELPHVDLHAACLMPDHVHLLISPRERDVVAFVRTWKSWTTRLAREAGHSLPLWQPGMWDRTCRDEGDFQATAAYIVQNPVAAGLVDDATEWPHTWAFWLESRGSAPA